ncbi:Sec-independent protein translocase protein TatCy [Stieleria neptunia]|uniref:Sec-independent protein translocase protein TatC n=1 Tax=Stieleria neptunia TaxID=2527979 RepID=A0A518HP60_9BACT|nr:twin-arginine translocase subunit TatC [Stieleria neptunia]QDV42630.1 Sec-independent protein translocase protein TatCy [Stieleria neptunia]
MTFGEHLEELRHSLVRAIICLGIGLAVGLTVANQVVRYVAEPLKAAIVDFNAKRSLAMLGYEDLDDPDVQALLPLITERSLKWQVIYEIPDELQNLTPESIELIPAAGSKSEASADRESPEPEPEPPNTEQPNAETPNAETPNAETSPDEQPDTQQPGGEPANAEQSAEAAAPDEEPIAESTPAVSIAGVGGPVAATPGARVKPREIADILRALPAASDLRPKVQFIRDTKGLSTFKVEESFMIWVKAGLIVGAVLSSPGVFYFLWQFVAAGLHQHERKYVYVYLPVSVTLFVSGVVLAFFLVLHYVLNFLLAFNGSMDVEVEPRLTYYINFVLLLPLGFGLAFQLPLVMLFLQRIGLIETEMYVGSWRVAILVIFVLSMLLTPADVTSMVALAVPLMFLYFLGIGMCHFIPRGPGLGSGAYDPA